MSPAKVTSPRVACDPMRTNQNPSLKSFLGILKLGGGAFFFFFFFFLFQGCACGIWRFPGQESNQSYSCWPKPQLMAMPDPTGRGQGSNPQPHRSQSDSFPLCQDGKSRNSCFELILVQGIQLGSHLILLQVDIQVSWYHQLKTTVLSTLIIHARIYIQTFYSISLVYVSIFM